MGLKFDCCVWLIFRDYEASAAASACFRVVTAFLRSNSCLKARTVPTPIAAKVNPWATTRPLIIFCCVTESLPSILFKPKPKNPRVATEPVIRMTTCQGGIRLSQAFCLYKFWPNSGKCRSNSANVWRSTAKFWSNSELWSLLVTFCALTRKRKIQEQSNYPKFWLKLGSKFANGLRNPKYREMFSC